MDTMSSRSSLKNPFPGFCFRTSGTIQRPALTSRLVDIPTLNEYHTATRGIRSTPYLGTHSTFKNLKEHKIQQARRIGRWKFLSRH